MRKLRLIGFNCFMSARLGQDEPMLAPAVDLCLFLAVGQSRQSGSKLQHSKRWREHRSLQISRSVWSAEACFRFRERTAVRHFKSHPVTTRNPYLDLNTRRRAP